MTAVDTSTGEVVPALAADDARRITDRIKVAVEVVWDLVAEAYQRRAWAALGYSSWDDYCTREFGTSRLRLPREERSEVVASLRESGLSLRAIAAVTGDSEPTVRRSVESSTASFDAVERVTGVNGKSYAASQPAAARARALIEAKERAAAERAEQDAWAASITPDNYEPARDLARQRAGEAAIGIVHAVDEFARACSLDDWSSDVAAYMARRMPRVADGLARSAEFVARLAAELEGTR